MARSRGHLCGREGHMGELALEGRGNKVRKSGSLDSRASQVGDVLLEK